MSLSDHNLQRFIDAQKNSYSNALTEIKNGRKRSHWMWFIFPQIKGLGLSDTSKYYAIKNCEEAFQYLKHPTLGNRLIEICETLLLIKSNDATQVFGSPDDLKLKSSMTLFSLMPETDQVFEKNLQKFFKGKQDVNTIRQLKEK